MSNPHEVLFTAALEQLPEGIVIVDAEDRIVFANSKAEEVRRIRFADIEGGDVRDCHPAESSERVERALAHIRKTRDAVFTRMVVDSVKERTYENTYAGLVGDNKEYLGLLVLTRDITDRLELESARASHMQALSQEVERLSRHLHELFVASMTALVHVLEAKDPYTAGHSDRVSEMAETMAMHAWGVAPKTSELALAGKLHDIGKKEIRANAGKQFDPQWTELFLDLFETGTIG